MNLNLQTSRYPNDTLTRESEVEHFTQHLNSPYDNIKFILEVEQDNKLAFLDKCACSKEDGSAKEQIYREATHIDYCVNWDSNHLLDMTYQW